MKRKIKTNQYMKKFKKINKNKKKGKKNAKK